MPTLHLSPASALSAKAPASVALAAMARPGWIERYTVGRPAWSYAVGATEALLWAALAERKAGTDGPATAAYFAALDARWARCVAEGRFAPGVWMYQPHGGGDLVAVPDGAVLVCACRADQPCHLDRLGPWIARSLWRVIGRDGAEVSGG